MSEIPPEGLIECKLGKFMQERHITVSGLSALAGLARPTVRNLRDNAVTSVSMTTIAKLCDTLGLGVGVLFVHNPKKVAELERDLALMGAEELDGG